MQRYFQILATLLIFSSLLPLHAFADDQFAQAIDSDQAPTLNRPSLMPESGERLVQKKQCESALLQQVPVYTDSGTFVSDEIRDDAANSNKQLRDHDFPVLSHERANFDYLNKIEQRGDADPTLISKSETFSQKITTTKTLRKAQGRDSSSQTEYIYLSGEVPPGDHLDPFYTGSQPWSKELIKESYDLIELSYQFPSALELHLATQESKNEIKSSKVLSNPNSIKPVFNLGETATSLGLIQNPKDFNLNFRYLDEGAYSKVFIYTGRPDPTGHELVVKFLKPNENADLKTIQNYSLSMFATLINLKIAKPVLEKVKLGGKSLYRMPKVNLNGSGQGVIIMERIYGPNNSNPVKVSDIGNAVRVLSGRDMKEVSVVKKAEIARARKLLIDCGLRLREAQMLVAAHEKTFRKLRPYSLEIYKSLGYSWKTINFFRDHSLSDVIYQGDVVIDYNHGTNALYDIKSGQIVPVDF